MAALSLTAAVRIKTVSTSFLVAQRLAMINACVISAGLLHLPLGTFNRSGA
jgi:hypothetical protein